MKYRILEINSGNYVKNSLDNDILLSSYRPAANICGELNEQFDGEYYVERVEDDAE